MADWRARLGAWRSRLPARLPGLLLVGQLALLGFAAQEGTRAAWLWALTSACGANLIVWLLYLRHSRAILDTPTSRIASAAQGYVELVGTAQPHGGDQPLSPLTQLPCLWYRYGVERREEGKWRYEDGAESDQPFELDDGSGRCVLDPAGAHIHSRHQEVRHEGDRRYTESVLLKGDPLYAIGEFGSTRGADQVLDARQDLGELLSDWKYDQAELHRRFDLDGDGALSAREWALAKLAARREVARRHQAIRLQPVRHHMKRPGGGGLYLITNHPPEAMGRRYARLAWLHLALLLAACAGLGWAVSLTPG